MSGSSNIGPDVLSTRPSTISSASSTGDGRPRVPTLCAFVREAELFLAEFLFSVAHSRSEAKADARKLRPKGKGLYETSAEQWVERLGYFAVKSSTTLFKKVNMVMPVFPPFEDDQLYVTFHRIKFNNFLSQGPKDSGWGREGGRHGIEEFQTVRVCSLRPVLRDRGLLTMKDETFTLGGLDLPHALTTHMSRLTMIPYIQAKSYHPVGEQSRSSSPHIS